MAIIEDEITVPSIRCVLATRQDMYDVFDKLMDVGYYTGGAVARDIVTHEYRIEVNREGTAPSVTGYMGQAIVAIGGPAEVISKAEYDERYPNG